MSSEVYYRPATPKVIHEIIDGEAVMIHMEKGFYYSLDRSGSIIWNLLEQGTTVRQIATILQDQYTGDAAEIEQSLHDFLSDLKQEDLIVPVNTVPDAQPVPSSTLSQTNGALSSGQKPSFVPPVLHKYTDMEDLLLLDPIHEVDDTGWPAVPDET